MTHTAGGLALLAPGLFLLANPFGDEYARSMVETQFAVDRCGVFSR